MINQGLNLNNIFYKKGKADSGCSINPSVGKSLNPIQGIKVLTGENDTDFALTGELPLIWDRQYSSKSKVGRGRTGDPIGWYGQGWSNAWGIQLNVVPAKDLIEVIDAYGRTISFPYMAIGSSFYSRFEDIRLHHDAQGQYRITSGASELGDGVKLHFADTNNKFDDTPSSSYPRKQHLYCTGQSDAYDNRITLEYHTHKGLDHLPQYVKDSAGRVLQLNFDTINHKENIQGNLKNIRLLQINELINLSDSKLNELLPKLDHTPQKQILQAKNTSIHTLISAIESLIDTGKLSKNIVEPHTLVHYHYDKQGDLIEVNPHLTSTRRFDYKNHIMIAHHIEDGLSSYYDYDEYLTTGKVLVNRISNGQTYHFDYFDDHTIVIEAKDSPSERQTLYHFNKDKHWTGITDGLGNRTTFVLDDYDRVEEVINPDGSKIINQYVGDTLAAVKQLTDYDPITKLPQWRTQQYLYEDNRLTELLDPLGNATKLAYDAKGQIKQITDANGISTYIERDDKGRTTKQILANGSSYQYEYNDKGELSKQTDCSGNPTLYTYDDLGRITTITDAKNNQTKLTYDIDNNGHKQHTPSPTHIIYPDGSQEHFVYDTLNRLTKYTDAKGQTTQYEYAIDDLPVKRIDALGHTLQYDYDNLRRLTTLTNENGEQWSFEYDKADNLISETRFDGMVSHYDYDKNGQLVHQTDNPTHNRAEQRHTYLQRDLIGQLTHKHSLDIVKNNGKVQQRHYKTKYQYDIAGQLIRATSPDASTHLDYDNIGQLISERLTRHHGGATVNEHTLTQTLTHEYDEIGNRIATTLPDGKVIKQAYYGSGHLYNQSIESNGEVTEIRHSERNELHQETTRQQGDLLSSFGYDPMGRLIKQYSSDHNNNHIVVERNYTYDMLGQLTHLSGQTRLGAVKGSHVLADQFRRNHQYDYDKVGRLTAHKLTDFANHTGTTEVFAFDPASNRVPVSTATTTDNTTDSGSQSKHIHKSGRPKTLTTHDSYITYTYDSHGRVLFKTKTPLGKDGKPLEQSPNSLLNAKQSVQHYYDANNELAKTITNTEEGFHLTTVTTHYKYDAFGRRIAKNSKTQVKTKLINRQYSRIRKYHIQEDKTAFSQVSFLWDGNRQIQEYKENLVFTTMYEHNSFVPVARLVWSIDKVEDSSIHVYHYHNDQLGTPNELSDKEGNIVWLADYKAWGGVAKNIYIPQTVDDIEVSETDLQPIRFQGQFIDQETGLHYNRFRYYDNDLGMFVSRDPIGLMGGNNTFQYAPNPTGWIDPFGLQSNNNSINYKLLQDVAKKAAQLKLGQSVTACSFKEADLVLFAAFPDAVKSAGAADKPSQKTSADKAAFKKNRQTPNGKASYHMDYKVNPTTGVLYGHESLPDGHPHKTIPHINIVTPEGKRVDIFVDKCKKKNRK